MSDDLRLLSFKEHSPVCGANVFVADGARVIGQATLGDDVNVWYNSVIRADGMPVTIGARTNIQDLSMVHVTTHAFDTVIGEDVTVGHRAIIHGCQVGDRCLIGMGAILLDGVVIGEECIIAAGSVVTPGTVIPPRSMVMGSPAKVKRPLHEHEIQLIALSALHYVELAREYQAG